VQVDSKQGVSLLPRLWRAKHDLLHTHSESAAARKDLILSSRYRAREALQTNSKLIRSTLKNDWLLWALFTALAVTTAWRESEIVWLFLLCGFVSMFIKAPPRLKVSHRAAPAFVGLEKLFTGAVGTATAATVGTLFLFFLKAGAFVFGSGLAIVPFLYGGIVGNSLMPLQQR